MKANPFNLCARCYHITSCVLTHQKNSVWSCSEFDDWNDTYLGLSDNVAEITLQENPETSVV